MNIRGHRRPNVVPITAPSFPTPPQPHIYRKIAYTFAAFTVLIIIAVLWLSSVRAEVNVKVKRTVIKYDGTVEIAKAPSSGQIAGRVVQGTFDSGMQAFDVQENTSTAAVPVTTEERASAPVTLPTTSVTATDEKVVARGTVRVINKYSRPQTLVKSTRLLTSDNKLYRIDKTISIPSKGEVSVGVYADKAGSEYAIGPTQFTIPGLWIDLQKFIYAVSDDAFVGTPGVGTVQPEIAPKPVAVKPAAPAAGASTSTKIVTEGNLRDAESVLKDAAFEQAKRTLAAELGETKFTGVVYFTKLIDKKFTVKAGDRADRFMASVKLDVTAVYYPPEDMSAFIRGKLKEKIPEGREFLPFNDQSVRYALESADAKSESASIHVSSDAEYRLTSASPALQKAAVAGKSKDEAIAALQALEGVDSVKVIMHPSWMSKIPTLKDHIDLKVE